MDRIVLAEVRLRAHVGVTEEERATEQEVLIDVELYLDLAPAGTADDLSETVDYAAVCRTVEEVARGRPFRLIETVAEGAARAVLERFPAVTEVLVRVRKPSALTEWRAAYAAVEIRRARDG